MKGIGKFLVVAVVITVVVVFSAPARAYDPNEATFYSWNGSTCVMAASYEEKYKAIGQPIPRDVRHALNKCFEYKKYSDQQVQQPQPVRRPGYVKFRLLGD